MGENAAMYSLDFKRRAAIDSLGENWVLHPQYSALANPHHSLRFRHSARLAAFGIACKQTRERNVIALRRGQA